ncbi:hypothetical protein GCM10023116_30960 [Kistimonas scapharcae]|uniref:Uncharacterized protein n=1 Tax=Kistimonas scapharcae TaxID=1036133 RepID=A0ABP8V5U8_9GAMM
MTAIKDKGERFTRAECDFMAEHWQYPRAWIAKKLGRSPEQVQAKMTSMGLTQGRRGRRRELYPQPAIVSPCAQLLSQRWQGTVTIDWGAAS